MVFGSRYTLHPEDTISKPCVVTSKLVSLLHICKTTPIVHGASHLCHVMYGRTGSSHVCVPVVGLVLQKSGSLGPN